MPFASRPRASRPGFRPVAVQCLLALTLVLLASSSALADTIKVITDRALVWNRPSGVASVVVTQLLKDETAEVVRRVGSWYEIVVRTGAFSDEFRTGFIAASQVVIDTTGPPSEQVTRAMAAAVPPARVPGNSFVNIDVARRRGGDALTRTVTAPSPTLGEDSTVASSYGDTTGWAVDFMAGGAVWRALGIGFGVSSHLRDRPALVSALVPHPYFYDTLRPVSFTTEPLRARETAVHIPAVFMPPLFGPVRVLLFAGPSVFKVSQIVVTDIALVKQPPYDTATISSVTTTERKGSFTGYHAGADVSVFLTPLVGVGVAVRYSRANIEQFDADTLPMNGTAGGTSAGVGVRFKF